MSKSVLSPHFIYWYLKIDQDPQATSSAIKNKQTTKKKPDQCCGQASLAKRSAVDYMLTIQNRTGSADFQCARSFRCYYIKKFFFHLLPDYFSHLL